MTRGQDEKFMNEQVKAEAKPIKVGESRHPDACNAYCGCGPEDREANAARLAALAGPIVPGGRLDG